MEVVSYPTLAPSVCVVCEGVPPETPFVDTVRTFEPSGWTHLNGRKYLCAICVNEAAQALDIGADAVAPVQAALDESAVQIAQLQADIENYQAIQGAITGLAQRPVVQVEGAVAAAVQAVNDKNKLRTDAAAEAQAALATTEAEVAAGAARQAELDQAAADAATAAGVLALSNPPTLDPITNVAIPQPVISPEASVGPDGTVISTNTPESGLDENNQPIVPVPADTTPADTEDVSPPVEGAPVEDETVAPPAESADPLSEPVEDASTS